MPSHPILNYPSFLGVTIALLGLHGLAYASMSEDDYLAALKIADRHVQKQKLIAAGASALSSTVLRGLYGRYYEVGDTWEVAAYRADSTLMRKIDDPAQLEGKGGDLGIFEYKVIAVKTGAQPEVTLQITQQAAYGHQVIDSEVERLLLKMTDKMTQSEKTYSIKRSDSAFAAVSVAPVGVRSRISPLELFPLDVPNVVTADRESATMVPELPVALIPVSRQAGYKPEITRSAWFEQSDFFGRPVQILWQQGDPWPAYLKTANGVAILLRKGGSS